MLTELEISGYRCFDRLALRGLTKINLLVGLNNAGKSSVLEAIQLLVRNGHPAVLQPVMQRRGELLIYAAEEFANRRVELDVRHLFRGHEIKRGSEFSIKGRSSDGALNSLRVWVDESDLKLLEENAAANPIMIQQLGQGFSFGRLFLRCDGSESETTSPKWWSALSAAGGLLVSHSGWNVFGYSQRLAPCDYVMLDVSPDQKMAEHWGQIALTSSQVIVEKSLQLLEPDVEAIAFVSDKLASGGAFKAKLRNQLAPVPLGSLGEGASRLFALLVALVSCKSGVLLVDEIDTGLHHSIMDDIWRVVLETAETLNVQVFATTHSLDCVRGLAQVCNDSESNGDDRISMHRIERGKSESIHYSEAEIVIAASEGIETR